jgi:hypothetical protein
LAGLTIDIGRIPFSRRGSYLAFNSMHAGADAPAGLYLRSVHAESAGRDRIFLVELVRGGRAVRFDVRAEPSVLHLAARDGEAEICFASCDDVRIRGRGVGVRLSEQWMPNAVSVPGPGDQWRFITSFGAVKFLLSPLVGRLSVEAPWTIPAPAGQTSPPRHKNPYFRATFAPASSGGRFEANMRVYSTEPSPRRDERTFAACLRDADADWRAWLDRTLDVPPQYAGARELAAYVQWSSIVGKRGLFDRQIMLMSKNVMAACWPWDACFNSLALARTMPRAAWDQFTYHLEMQDGDGAVPDKVSDSVASWSFTKAPVHGWMLRWMMRHAPRVATAERLRRLYPPMARATNWWLNFRDDGRTGLCQYHHGNDCGWDNATAFDAGVPLRSADLATWLAIQMDVLQELATMLGRQQEARRWRAKSRRMVRAMDTLWRGGRFVALVGEDARTAGGEQSLFAYVPILLGEMLDKRIAAKMVEDLRRGGFLLTDHGLATESPSSPHYCRNGYWRGPIWAPTTLMMVDSLARVGERAFAADLARRFCEMCVRSGFAENYDAVTGEGLCDPGYTWSAGVFLVLAHWYL